MANMLVYFKKLHRFAGFKLYVPLLGIMVISMIEGVGYFLLVAMLGIIGLFDTSSEAIPILTTILEPVKGYSAKQSLTVVLVVFLIVWVGQAFIYRYLTMMNEKITHGFVKAMRLEIYESIIRAKWVFFLQ